MQREIVYNLLKFDRDPKIKVIIIMSKVPKAFCAGANIQEFTSINLEN